MITNNLLASNLLLIASVSFLFLLWRTNSIKVSISTTIFVSSCLGFELFRIMKFETFSYMIIIGAMAVLTWRAIPHEEDDKWKKA